MAKRKYSSELCKELAHTAENQQLEIRHRPVRYENGTVLPMQQVIYSIPLSSTTNLYKSLWIPGAFVLYRCGAPEFWYKTWYKSASGLGPQTGPAGHAEL
jgi:hypothetical protein